jgi:hypothetical protein
MRSLPAVRCWLFALVVSVVSVASFAQVSTTCSKDSNRRTGISPSLRGRLASFHHSR